MASGRIRIKDLVTLTGLSRATVSRHVAGEIEPPLSSRASYARVFGMSVHQFDALWRDPPGGRPGEPDALGEDLAIIAGAWPKLSLDIRTAVLALVKASAKRAEEIPTGKR